MNTKSERLEIRVEPDLIARLDRWRAQQPDVPARGEAVRRLIEMSIEQSKGFNIEMSDAQKLMLMMLAELHKKPADRETEPQKILDALYSGATWGLKWEMRGLFHEYQDREEDVRFVIDVLDMWQFIERAVDKFTAKERAEYEGLVPSYHTAPKFDGFDGNYEAEMVDIVRTLVDRMNRFKPFKGRSYNSHRPVVDQYKRMLRVFEPIRKTLTGRELSADEVARIVNADQD